MSGFERMARLPDGPPMQEPMAQVILTVTESNLQGLTALVHWLDGLQVGDAGHRCGTIPGHFELVMHLRQLDSEIRKQDPRRKRDEEWAKKMAEKEDKVGADLGASGGAGLKKGPEGKEDGGQKPLLREHGDQSIR